MSKYSMGELIEELERCMALDYSEAIIATLKAADNLCEAAKEAVGEHGLNESLDDLSKAIAEYEGKP